MLIFLYRSAAHHGSHAVLKFLKVFLIVQVAVIAVSALHRMNLYQDVFGFTVLRLYVEWFIYFSLGILVLAGGSILINWPFRSFFYTTMVLGLAAFGIVASINVDRMIARENVDRFLEEGRELDINYLVHTLSPDTIPEIQRINERGDYLYQREQKEDGAFSVVHNNLGNSVVVSIKYYPKTHSWREYNFGLEEAQKVADKLPKF
jgi:hypothetical protein